jgi:hypothetical protein
MTVVTTIDVYDMPNLEYRAVLDRMGVEAMPEPGIYPHVTAQTDFGFRVIELRDRAEGFEALAQRGMLPPLTDLGIDRKTTITIKPLHNLLLRAWTSSPAWWTAFPAHPRRDKQPSSALRDEFPAHRPS